MCIGTPIGENRTSGSGSGVLGVNVEVAAARMGWGDGDTSPLSHPGSEH